MPRLFYNRAAIGDVLLIIYNNDLIPNKINKNGNVVSLYFDSELVGINIFDISKIIKIFHNGEIEDPTSNFIEIINHILINANLKPLEVK